MCLHDWIFFFAKCVSACTHLVSVYRLFGEGHKCEPKSNYKYNNAKKPKKVNFIRSDHMVIREQ